MSGSIVLVRTGWAAFWPNRLRYMGTAAAGDVQNLHFPGISAEAAKLLVARRVDGVGITQRVWTTGHRKPLKHTVF